ncbi:hypothetical protein [Butyrivibrio sp. MB2005]|uniref:hypothetical protein n=1 Tax=Butyrivibrio sp. MB2005 TaxID=1280678 RepID=UPI00042383B9|nr:hypothetical protein [Butyrivibrio sp. MB2005]
MISRKSLLYTAISFTISALLMSGNAFAAKAATISDGCIELVGKENPVFDTSLLSGDTLKNGVTIKNSSWNTDLIVVLGDEEVTIRVGEELVLDGDWVMESIETRDLYSDSQDDEITDTNSNDTEEPSDSNSEETSNSNNEENNDSNTNDNNDSNTNETSDDEDITNNDDTVSNNDNATNNDEVVNNDDNTDNNISNDINSDDNDEQETNNEAADDNSNDANAITKNSAKDDEVTNDETSNGSDTSAEEDQAPKAEEIGSVIIDLSGAPTGYVVSSNDEATYTGTTADKHARCVKILDKIVSQSGKTYTVTAITDDALKNASGKELIIGKSIKNIGKRALKGAKYKKITIKTSSNGSLSVGKNAFKVKTKKVTIKLQGVKGKNKTKVINKIRRQSNKDAIIK